MLNLSLSGYDPNRTQKAHEIMLVRGNTRANAPARRPAHVYRNVGGGAWRQ
jgi:hypothetical protein